MGDGDKSEHSNEDADAALVTELEQNEDAVSPICNYKNRADFATLGEILVTWTEQFPVDDYDEDDEDPAEDGTLCTGPTKMWRPLRAVCKGWNRLRLHTAGVRLQSSVTRSGLSRLEASESHTLVQYRELLRQIMTRIPQYKMCSEQAIRELVKNVELFGIESGSLICRPKSGKKLSGSRSPTGRPSIRPSVLGDSASSYDDKEEIEVAHLLLNGTALVFPAGFRIPEALPNRWYTKVALASSRGAASPRYANVDASNLSAWGLRPHRNPNRTRASTLGVSRKLETMKNVQGHSNDNPSSSPHSSPQSPDTCSGSRQRLQHGHRFYQQRRGISPATRPELSPNDCLPGARTVPLYRVLDPISPHEGKITICALENSVVAVIPRSFLHSSELEKEADKVERRKNRYALNNQDFHVKADRGRKSEVTAIASTIKQAMKDAMRQSAVQNANERVKNSQEMLKKKLLASTLRETMCAAYPGGAAPTGSTSGLPETPEDVQDLFPSLDLAQAEKVFGELAPDNAKLWRTAQDKKKEETANPKRMSKMDSKMKWKIGAKRASSHALELKEAASLTAEAAEFEKIKEHWTTMREQLGLAPVVDESAKGDKGKHKFGSLEKKLALDDETVSDWQSEPIFLRALDAGDIGTQSVVDGSLQEFLIHVPAFATLRKHHAPDGRSWEQVYNLFTVKRVPEGTSLLEEGEVTDRIIGIMAGEVEISTTVQFRESSCRPRNHLIREKQTDVGEAEVAFRVLGPGDFLGHFRPAAQPYRSSITARARTACRVCRSSAATTCGRVLLQLHESGSQMMEDLHEAATGWIPSQQKLRKVMLQQRQWATFKDRAVQQLVAEPIDRTARTWFHRAPGAEAWLHGGEADAYRSDMPSINLAEGGPSSIRGGRPTSATLLRQVKDSRSAISLVPYACRLRDKSPVFGADLAKRNSRHCAMVRNQATTDGTTRPHSAPGGVRRSASAPGLNAASANKNAGMTSAAKSQVRFATPSAAAPAGTSSNKADS